MLHIVNKSPFEKNTLGSCLRLAKPGCSILLIEDGIYAAMANTAFAERLDRWMKEFSFYVLQPDVTARGLDNTPLIEGIKAVNYEGFVDLVAAHDATHSWL